LSLSSSLSSSSSRRGGVFTRGVRRLSAPPPSTPGFEESGSAHCSPPRRARRPWPSFMMRAWSK
jgi:hypothetical protein